MSGGGSTRQLAAAIFGAAGAAVAAVGTWRYVTAPVTGGSGKNPVFEQRESRKMGRDKLVESWSYGSGEHNADEIQKARSDIQPERAHHMRTGQPTLQRTLSRNPNVKRSLSKGKSQSPDANASEK